MAEPVKAPRHCANAYSGTCRRGNFPTTAKPRDTAGLMWPPAGQTIKFDSKHLFRSENALFWGTCQCLTPCHERNLYKEHNYWRKWCECLISSPLFLQQL